MPWRYHICFAKCLYSYRDDLPETVDRSIAHEWKTSTSVWHASLPSDYCGQVSYPGGNVVCWVEFVVDSNGPPLGSLRSLRNCFCAFESFGGEGTILAALPTSSQPRPHGFFPQKMGPFFEGKALETRLTSSQPLIQNFAASRERSRRLRRLSPIVRIQPAFRDTSLVSLWNDVWESILMTCHHPDLHSSSDWLKKVFN